MFAMTRGQRVVREAQPTVPLHLPPLLSLPAWWSRVSIHRVVIIKMQFYSTCLLPHNEGKKLCLLCNVFGSEWMGENSRREYCNDVKKKTIINK